MRINIGTKLQLCTVHLLALAEICKKIENGIKSVHTEEAEYSWEAKV